jgi:hypothetical protein
MNSNPISFAPSVSIPSFVVEDVIYLEIEIGIYDYFQSVGITSLCRMNVAQLSYFYDANLGSDFGCPHPGKYELTTYYYVPPIRDYNFHYTPDIRLTFMDKEGLRIGCVSSGPVAIHKANDVRAVHGFIALGISIAVFVCIFSALLFLSHRRKKRIEQLREKRGHTISGTRYQYFRTLPNGDVVPLPSNHQHPASLVATRQQSQQHLPKLEQGSDEEDDDDSENVLNISNPAYNETQMPTRPII